MKAILCSLADKEIPAEVAVVISNNPDAGGLDIAREFGVKTHVISSRGFDGTRCEYDMQIIKALKHNGITPSNGLVCLAGFMRILGTEFIREYKNRIINIHPSLLPAFPGLEAQRQAIEYGAKYSGCTVHFVDSGMDTGPIIVQAAVAVDKDDTQESLSRKILEQEHKIYPRAIRLLAEGRVRITGRRTTIQSHE